MRLKLYLLLLLTCISVKVIAQDVNLTQYYASPLWLNPAFTGAVEQYRLATTYRNQWVQVPQSFQTNLASFDYNLINANSGIGALIYSDRIADLNLSRTHLSLSYAYSFFTGTNWQIRLGLQAGYTLQRQTLDGLTFGDQLVSGGASGENVGDFSAGIFDLAAGAVIYSPKTWLGIAAYHLHRPANQPNANALPLRLSIHAGTTVMVQGRALLPSVLFQSQAGFQQLDAGANYLLNDVLIVGAWYRGLPIQSQNQDALAALVGVNINGFTISYSYDYNISPLRGAPGGSHEISLIYAPAASRKFKRKYTGKQYIQCPTFRTK